MKTTAVIVPLVVVSMIFGLVWSVSLLTLKASSEAIEANLELLRLHMRVARLHEAVLVHSRESLERELEQLDDLARRAAAWNAANTADYGPGVPVSTSDPDLTIEPGDLRSAAVQRSGSDSGPAE